MGPVRHGCFLVARCIAGPLSELSRVTSPSTVQIASCSSHTRSNWYRGAGPVVRVAVPLDRSGGEVAALATSFLAVLPSEVLARVAAEAVPAGLGAGQLLYEPELSVIVEGRVRAFIADPSGRQLTVGYLSASSAVGLARLAGRRYPTAFQGLAPTRLLRVGDERFTELIRGYPRLGWAAAEEISTHLDGVEAELARVAFKSLRQRLAYHLLALLPANQDDHLPVHQAQLAAAVGSVREVVARSLAPLRQEGLVEVGPAGIVVSDRLALARLAGS